MDGLSRGSPVGGGGGVGAYVLVCLAALFSFIYHVCFSSQYMDGLTPRENNSMSSSFGFGNK